MLLRREFMADKGLYDKGEWRGRQMLPKCVTCNLSKIFEVMFPISTCFGITNDIMMLRHPFLLAAFGASLLSAPAFAQGAYNSGYGAVPPGYVDPYAQQGAGGQQGGTGAGLERTELAPPSGYEQAPTYQGSMGAPAQASVPPQATVPAQQGYEPQGYQQAAYPQASYPQGSYPQGGGQQDGASQASAYDEQQRMYGQHYSQPYDAQQGQGQVYEQQQQPYGAQAATQAAPAGIYATDAALVPGTDQAPSGPRIEDVDPAEPVPERFRRQEVDYATNHPAGTLIVDTPNTYLYYVMGNGRAMRYGIGVGREGFTWTGVQKVSRKAEWPDWRPPSDMIARQPYLPRFMAGGPGNPMGARALYLGSTIYRIHGTNEPQTIGKFVSSGCIRMLNNDAEDLYDRVKVGSKVVIMPMAKGTQTTAAMSDAPATTGSIASASQ